MRVIAKLAAILLILLCSRLTAGVYSSREFGGCFVVPDGWDIDSSYYDQIILTYRQNADIALTIKRYILERENRVGSDEQLAAAITGLYKDLNVDVSGGDAAEYSIKRGVASFHKSWTEFEKSEQVLYEKYLTGYLGRLIDGNQVLYLIIAEAPKDRYEQIFPQFLLVANSFQIVRDLMKGLYPGGGFSTYVLVLVLFLLAVFFFARNRRVQKSRNPLGRDSSSFWRCRSCGRVNHTENSHCNRCGRERADANSVRR
jgi:hypothetical protein